MKIFAVFARIELSRKPEWLDDFRIKYDKPYELHITLKQPCRIEPEQLLDIQERLARWFEASHLQGHQIPVLLDRLTVNTEAPDGICVMINTDSSPLLHELQKKIVAVLDPYRDYYRPVSRQWEAHFTPHITIARALAPAVWEEARGAMSEDVSCTGIVSEIVLVAVDRFTAEEAYRPENLTVYRL